MQKGYLILMSVCWCRCIVICINRLYLVATLGQRNLTWSSVLSRAMEDQADETSTTSTSDSSGTSTAADSESDESVGANLHSQSFFQVTTNPDPITLHTVRQHISKIPSYHPPCNPTPTTPKLGFISRKLWRWWILLRELLTSDTGKGRTRTMSWFLNKSRKKRGFYKKILTST